MFTKSGIFLIVNRLVADHSTAILEDFYIRTEFRAKLLI